MRLWHGKNYEYGSWLELYLILNHWFENDIQVNEFRSGKLN